MDTGVVATWKYFKSPLNKISAWYGPKIAELVRKHHILFIGKKRVKFRYVELLAKTMFDFQFWLDHFLVSHLSIRNLIKLNSE